MAWYDYINPVNIYRKAMDSTDRSQNEFREVDPKKDLRIQSRGAADFANESQAGMRYRTGQMQGVIGQLQDQASGENSLSAEQLRQSLGQVLGGQRSMAAGARPGNAAMAARTAAIQGGRVGSGLAGQQALAGIAERNAATQSLGGILGQMRGQDLQGALGSRGQAIGGFGDIERLRAQRFGTMMGQPTRTEKGFGLVSDLAKFGQSLPG